jgi:glucosamine 6-phosphate synthetase-like amidotransferase/phosphosugar isomerase protein
MCGIFAYAGLREAEPILIDGLSRLEYRGYDSAGLATVTGGPVIAIATEGDDRVAARADEVISVPDVPDYLQPLVTVVPLQLLAYHIALLRDCDVDKPRNLAKSVTVE